MLNNNFAKWLNFPLLLVFTLMFNQEIQWNGRVKYEDGKKIIFNPSFPIYSNGSFFLRPELTIGNDSKSGIPAFSSIKQVILDEKGNIYIADDKECCIKVFNDQGNYLKTIGKKGQGPGEFNGIISLSFSGNNLLVQDINLNLTFFSSEGVFIKKLFITKEHALLVKADRNENILAQCAIIGEKRKHRLIPYQGFILKKFDKNLKLLYNVTTFPSADPEDFDITRLPVWDIGASSQIIYGYPDKYQISVIKNEAKIQVEREYEKIRLNDEESAAINKMIPVDASIQISSFHGAFSNIILDDSGKLFVRTWEKDRAGHFYYDIFDEEGRYIFKIPFSGNLQIVRKDKAFSVEEDDKDMPILRIYSIKWK